MSSSLAEELANALAAVLKGDFFHDSLMSAHYPRRDVYNADAAHTLPAVLIEGLVQSTPDHRLLLLAAAPCAHGRTAGYADPVRGAPGPGLGRRARDRGPLPDAHSPRRPAVTGRRAPCWP
ncbi:hypothetical protein GCM10012286_61760 [Streptomyces lasiicapitis]|uniref:Uncharacterized protein n=1 Tax=Streptomyces lasiicapitis TaxID=1923961 RepID=A0ABQ2MLF3_9ACTN|nr:hypothetical protein GCM10012286_61760 [Streptomyces lasiicapitis]